MVIRLSRCPFCGDIARFDETLYADYIQIRCIDCNAGSTLIQADKYNCVDSVKERLAIIWNRRVSV